MISIDTARLMVLSFPEVTEQPHFHLTSFRIKNKIFATLWEAEKKMMVKLSLVDQSVYCSIDKNVSDFLWYDRLAVQFQYPKSMTIDREVESCEPSTVNHLHPCDLRYDMI